MTENNYFNLIKKLSIYDTQLATRSYNKKQIARISKTSQEYVSKMLHIKENGTIYDCGSTQSWVTEVFQGMEKQYIEYRNKIGEYNYKVFSDFDIIPYFANHVNSNNTIIYCLRHSGTEDHVFTIEQLPKKKGYLIYQSYKSTYNLFDWLATDITHYKKSKSKICQKIQAIVNQSIIKISNGASSLQNLKNLPEVLQPFSPYFDYINAYNNETVITNFEKAWNNYGKGRILCQEEFFDSYLPETAKLIEFFNNTTNSPHPEKIWNTWIELYGSANPLHYPNLPNNFITNVFCPNTVYKFKIMEIPLSHYSGEYNTRILENAIFDSDKTKFVC